MNYRKQVIEVTRTVTTVAVVTCLVGENVTTVDGQRRIAEAVADTTSAWREPHVESRITSLHTLESVVV